MKNVKHLNAQPKPLTPLAEWVIKTDKDLQDIGFAIIDLQKTLRQILESK